VRLAWSRGDFKRALELWEWYRGAEGRSPVNSAANSHAGIDFASLADGPVLPELMVVRDACRRLIRQTVVTYAELTGGIAVWVCDDRGISARWIKTADGDLRRAARRFVNLVADPTSDLAVIRSDGRYLYQQVIAPISQRLDPGRTLVFELDGELARVPLQALVTPSEEYFGVDNLIA
jgi:hypothetical protein